jgi:CBS domain-containing protein
MLTVPWKWFGSGTAGRKRRNKMKVKDVMVRTPVSCNCETNLAAAVELLWNRNCGFLPVVESDGKVKGVVTDRDLCIALGTRNRLASEIVVGEVMTDKLFSCSPDEDIHSALQTMRTQRVRRLPIIARDGTLQGILSMDDVVYHVGDGRKSSELSYEDIVSTFKGIYAGPLPEPVQAKSVAA